MTRGVLVWLLLMLVETIHGVLRTLLIMPRIGEEEAMLLGWPLGVLLVLVTTLLTIRWINLESTRDLLRLGGLWGGFLGAAPAG